jgi:two-component system chemotaxis response regulator CheY
MRVLIVDDQPTMRRIVARFVMKAGADECREAVDGRDALRILAVTTVDLIVTDWNMPGMSGLDFIRAVRSNEATKTVPVLMVTTNDSREHVLAALKAGVTDFVVKPFKGDVLTEHLYALLHPQGVGSPDPPKP